MPQPPALHDAVAEVIKAVDQAPTIWQAELAVSQVLGTRWLALPLGPGVLIDTHLRIVTTEAAKFGGHGRTVQAVLAQLSSNEETLARVNMSSRALGVLQPWVPLLDSIELIEAREGNGRIVLHCGYRLDVSLIEEHYLVLTVQDGMVQRCDVLANAPATPTQTVDPADLAPRLATIMANTTSYFTKLTDPDSVYGPWALLTARVLTCLPAVLAITRMTEQDAKALAARFVRLKATKRLSDESGYPANHLGAYVTHVIGFERQTCPGGWTPEMVRRFYTDGALGLQWADQEVLGQVVIGYLVWRMGKLGYKPLVEAASDAHVRYLEGL